MVTKRRRWLGTMASVLCVLGATTAVARVGGGRETERPARWGRFSAREHRYALGARVRLLLFWMGKDNVGEARLAWLTDATGARGYELLIGSDPAKAPRQINRWGYVSECETASGVQVFGLMTEADEQSLEQAKATTGTIADGSRVFKIIRETVGGDNATSLVQGVALSNRLTLHDVDAVIAQVPEPRPGKSVRVPPGVDPGFLFSMAALIHENVESAERSGRAPVGTRRSYVYANKLYGLVTRSSKVLKQVTIKGRTYTHVIESEFETRAEANGDGAVTCRVVYATQGALREVPVQIVYRPKWWFEAEIVLVDGTRE